MKKLESGKASRRGNERCRSRVGHGDDEGKFRILDHIRSTPSPASVRSWDGFTDYITLVLSAEPPPASTRTRRLGSGSQLPAGGSRARWRPRPRLPDRAKHTAWPADDLAAPGRGDPSDPRPDLPGRTCWNATRGFADRFR